MRQNNSFSQVFLKDKYYIRKAVAALDCRGKTVLEVGAGYGQISRLIAEKSKLLYCVEIDLKLIESLRTNFIKNKNIKVIQADIRDISLLNFKEKLIIFSNVPYHLSSQLIKYLINYRQQISKSYLILQKEFVEKISAKPGSKPYGLITCLAQYYGKIKHLFDIPAGAFAPSPKVKSSFIELEFYKTKPLNAENDGFLFNFIGISFKQRRKKIATIIRQQFSVEAVKRLIGLGLDLNRRPEQLSLEDFCRISDYLGCQ
ncbi:MAG: 16S rRNA (adenine(1518)-N(6)/adenine(1519)-N(6))-dimethyltransferase RsmA [Candidatus Omnitrophica bacterium]|nr:16S rRNA (adenine(1518)-N(6)/adenine(1519)-N(6))-dimethyltransferase RsmA [Candidatus Omnitrophota bacterium]MCF7877112.1 16S rRNA (adenine(1518)-N(6)/adenine(1519)-N(6))-dimethyltransferase RsmA [Candidatus Omnitrophota bacterium]MCF7892031.1 16S rRNA (adenine(1518)-N(6)/adenine(1519)-N(6))-dimethyltransferase RsmA [Candidatus Omnitrophota bacterium]MCF7895498.1 16S rRNA (adenine(1518)-N(6)/adenine(1519)-N(6))-dimethyltransferase RsmA [Candidatus Omnitrophota bacterium]MCF7898192.1 16S rRNA